MDNNILALLFVEHKASFQMENLRFDVFHRIERGAACLLGAFESRGDHDFVREVLH